MFDSVKGRYASKRIYRGGECVNMRVSQTVPDGTGVWIGRANSPAAHG